MSSIYRRGKWWHYKALKNRQAIYKPLKTTDRQEAKYLQAKLDQELAENRIPLHNARCDQTIGKFVESLSPRCSPKYIYETRHRLNIITKDILFLSEITEQSVIDRLKQFPGSYDYNNSVSAVKAWIRWCLRNGYITKNPADNIKKIVIQESPRQSFTPEEVERIILYSKGEEIYPAVLTAIYSGMRKTELFTLTWASIDLKQRVFTLSQTKSRKVRRIPIHPVVYAVLEAITPKEGLVFKSINSRRILKRIFRNAVVSGGWHHFRHTFCTHLLRNGADLKTVCALAGHSAITITSKYLSTTPQHLTNAVELLQFCCNKKAART